MKLLLKLINIFFFKNYKEQMKINPEETEKLVNCGNYEILNKKFALKIFYFYNYKNLKIIIKNYKIFKFVKSEKIKFF